MELFSPSSFQVVLDANILFSAPLRDTLLRCAASNLYRARWSSEILEEMRSNLVKKGLMTEGKSHDLAKAIRTNFPEAEVEGYEYLIDSMRNDPKDRHVVAAAVACGAGVIVTLNLSDFAPATLPSFVRAKSPDDFLHDLVDLDPSKVIEILQSQARDLKAPPHTLEELLTKLARYAPRFVHTCRSGLKGPEDEELHEARTAVRGVMKRVRGTPREQLTQEQCQELIVSMWTLMQLDPDFRTQIEKFSPQSDEELAREIRDTLRRAQANPSDPILAVASDIYRATGLMDINHEELTDIELVAMVQRPPSSH